MEHGVGTGGVQRGRGGQGEAWVIRRYSASPETWVAEIPRQIRQGRVDGGRGDCRSRESLLPAAFAIVPVPQSRPWFRFPPPLIEPDVRLYSIRLSEGLHEQACTGLR
jgi:hypothetical protein